jgi:hypothetical protein
MVVLSSGATGYTEFSLRIFSKQKKGNVRRGKYTCPAFRYPRRSYSLTALGLPVYASNRILA